MGARFIHMWLPTQWPRFRRKPLEGLGGLRTSPDMMCKVASFHFLLRSRRLPSPARSSLPFRLSQGTAQLLSLELPLSA